MFTMTPHLETSIFASYYRQQTMLLIYIYMTSKSTGNVRFSCLVSVQSTGTRSKVLVLGLPVKKNNNSSSSKQLVLAADYFVHVFIRINHPSQHICSMVPLTSLTQSQLSPTFPVDFDVIYILITSFALGNNSQKCWFPDADRCKSYSYLVFVAEGPEATLTTTATTMATLR